MTALLLLSLHVGLTPITPTTTVDTKVISIHGFPGPEPSQPNVSNYGHKPSVTVTANANNQRRFIWLKTIGR